MVGEGLADIMKYAMRTSADHRRAHAQNCEAKGSAVD
jgi:hypothetical protein